MDDDIATVLAQHIKIFWPSTAQFRFYPIWQSPFQNYIPTKS
jgi:hypothetical protein